MKCVVCGITSHGKERCQDCREVHHFVTQLTLSQRADYVLVVDGSFTSHPVGKGHRSAGAGLVLAREYDEVVVACCAASFSTTSSNCAELEAILRGLKWAPGVTVWSDSKPIVKQCKMRKWPVFEIKKELRDPLHHLAHKLANIGRLQAWDKLERVWVPGEVWP
jgi:ribonuclease HI